VKKLYQCFEGGHSFNNFVHSGPLKRRELMKRKIIIAVLAVCGIIGAETVFDADIQGSASGSHRPSLASIA
jgi:hypothetical protein